MAPLVIPGILLAARVAASGASSRLAGVLERRTLQAVLAASAMAAVAPVCGVTVLPLMAGLLASGAPLAPVAAFWLSSPITDPAMLAATAAILGPDFAIAKTAAAFGLGIFAGIGTALAGAAWAAEPLRPSRLMRSLGARPCSAGADAFGPLFWPAPRSLACRPFFFSREVMVVMLCLFRREKDDGFDRLLAVIAEEPPERRRVLDARPPRAPVLQRRSRCADLDARQGRDLFGPYQEGLISKA